MEIQALKLLVTEQEINDLAVKLLPQNQQVRDVRARLAPEGIYVTGVYQTLIGVPFETLWQLGARNGKVTARLANFKAAGFGAGMLRGTLMTAIGDAAKKEDSLQVEGETLVFDLDRLLAKKGFPARTNLTAVWCNFGNLFIESGSS
jgi:hypothetical protein